MAEVGTNSIKAWILAARPKTLSGAAVPVIVALTKAWADTDSIVWIPAVLCLLFALIMQIDANFVNDYFDCIKGVDGKDRLGPERACAQGWVTLPAMRWMIAATTLLAAVDSSVGGKTAIDLDVGKNLAGAFYQPRLVLCDIDVLKTLPVDIFRDGCAEVIKYGVLYDPELFDHLARCGISFDREYVITRCVDWKRNAVARDEFDTGERMLLNLGHTFGHGIEAHSHFTLSHGQAVAIGMAIVSRASRCADAERIISLLERFGLPTAIDFSVEDILSYVLSDKKRTGGTVNLIVPESIGCCRIVPTPVESLKSFLEAGL